jgi:hypothetical protein
VSQHGGHGRDQLGQPGAQPLDGTPVGGGEDLPGERLAQVAEQPVFGEERLGSRLRILSVARYVDLWFCGLRSGNLRTKSGR